MLNRVIESDIKDIVSILGSELRQLEGKNVLITGAAGMVASYLVYTLIHANETLFGKAAQLYLVVRSEGEFFGTDKNIHYIRMDIAKDTPPDFGYHYIVHAASKAAPKFYTANMIDTLNTNILGLYHLLEVCSDDLKSILYISSAEIYGSPRKAVPIDEKYIGVTDHLNQRACYVEGKRAAETICLNYFWERQLPVKIARLFHTFGPGMNINDGKALSDFIKNGIEGKDIQIMGDKTLSRSFLYIKDAAVMLFILLLSDKNGEVFNVGNDRNVSSIGKLAKIVCDCFNRRQKYSIGAKKGRQTIKVLEQKQNLSYYHHAVKAIIPNIDKYYQTFYYKPETGLKEAVERTADFFLDI